jgi:hypothetical protein
MHVCSLSTRWSRRLIGAADWLGRIPMVFCALRGIEILPAPQLEATIRVEMGF